MNLVVEPQPTKTISLILLPNLRGLRGEFMFRDVAWTIACLSEAEHPTSHHVVAGVLKAQIRSDSPSSRPSPVGTGAGVKPSSSIPFSVEEILHELPIKKWCCSQIDGILN